jgi:hypothetical protein
MVTVGQRTLDVVNLHNSGIPITDIAKQLGMTPSSVEKRLRSYKKIQAGGWAHKKTIQDPRWNTDNIKEGFERFIEENGRLPTTYEIDDCSYLPSSRQLQRRFGGLGNLREALGYGKILFNTGDYRKEKQKVFRLRGADAEDELEKMLADIFGPLFVHSEQRFAGTRNRVDFVVHAKDITLAMDVFTTDDRRTFVKNIAVKVPKYLTFPTDIPLFFVLWGDNLSQKEIDSILSKNIAVGSLPSLRVVNTSTLFEYLEGLEPLTPPEGYKPLQ